jgi:hypothetical protein
MTIKSKPVTAIKRTYPHVNEIPDWQTAQSARLLWDRVHDLEERLQAASGTITDLVAGHNANEGNIISTGKDVRQAIALSQGPGGVVSDGGGAGGAGGGGGIGGGGGGPLPGEPGSQTNPIIAMSIVPAQIAASVRASLAFYGLPASADQYWIDVCSTAGRFSNGKWYQGWNAYWEARAAPGNSGSANPNLAGLPSVHQ